MRRLGLVTALALTLSACGVEPRDELRGDVEAVTLAANVRDVAELRDAVAELRATIRRQVAADELVRAKGERLNAIALQILENAELLEGVEPSPEPTEEPEPEPTEEPSPEPEPTEEPEPEPTEEPEEEPVQTEEPQPEPTVEIELPPVEESPPSAQSQSGSDPSPQPTPAA